jgi:hypothetical protein
MNEFANKDVSFLDGNSIKDFYQEQVEFCEWGWPLRCDSW